MDRFLVKSPADLARNVRMYQDPNESEEAICFYCDRRGGVPYLMIGDDLHCSRCFEDFTPEEFRAWLADPPLIVESMAGRTKRDASNAAAVLWTAAGGTEKRRDGNNQV